MITERIPLWEGRQDVALYTFLAEKDPVLPGQQEKLPALIICPGGAYMFCSMKYEGDAVAMNFAAAGYQTFVLQYTVGTTCGSNSPQYPAQLRDLGKAFLTIREHAEEWLVDVERICVAGFSAGAHLCATLATRWHEPVLSDYFNVEPSCFRPLGAILGYSLTDYMYQEQYNATQKPNPMLQASNQAFFGTLTPSEEQLKEVSPCLHVSDKTPPIFMMHAANDSMVPVVHSMHMATALQEKNIPFELHIFQNGEHGFAAGVPVGTSDYRVDSYKACRAWIDMAKVWLLHLVAPETAEHDVSSADLFGDDDSALPPFFV